MDNQSSSLSTPSILLSTLSVIHRHESASASSRKNIRDASRPPPSAVIQAGPPADLVPANPGPPAQQEAGLGVEATRPKLRIAAIMSSLCACVFVAAIDVTIISTALPAIAGNFQSASGYQWVGSAYVLGSTASTPSWGKVSDIWGRKPILLLAVIIFFAGSLICALGQNMPVFLTGRAVQGVGASGLLTLVNIAISDLFSMRDRSLYYGMTSVVWALASSFGPIIGGVFAQKLS